MTKRISDRDMLTRTLYALQGGNCCRFFACPGPDHKPVAMASCAQATMVYELREFMRRNGGWCPEHGQELARCHGGETSETGYNPNHKGRHPICYCRPVSRAVNRAHHLWEALSTLTDDELILWYRLQGELSYDSP